LSKSAANSDQIEGAALRDEDAVFSVRPDGTILSWSPGFERIFGYRRSEAIGRKVQELLRPAPDSDSPEAGWKQLLRKAASGASPPELEQELINRRGDRIRTQIRLRPVREGQGITEILVTGRTSAPQPPPEQFLHRQRLASLGQLAAEVAHQISTPLAAIQGRAQMLQRSLDAPRPDFLVQELKKIVRDCERIDSITRRLLEFSGKAAPERQAVAINTVVEAALELVRPRLLAEKVITRRSFQADLPSLWACAHYLEQVFVNLFCNAIDAMAAGGGPDGKLLQVTTSSRRGPDGPRIRVTVSDCGDGIRPADLKRVFEPFFTTKAPSAGTGLGLPVVKTLVEFHQGTIEVTSARGSGTEFVVELPVAGPDGAGPG